MATLEATASIDTSGINIRGEKVHRSGQTVSQISGRATNLVSFTVMAQKGSDSEWQPLTDADPALTSAYLTCGANGGAVAAYQAVSDGEFSVTVDGEVINITGLVFTAVTALTDIADIINIAAAGRFVVRFDERLGTNGTFVIQSASRGLPESRITVLSAVSGGSGTDISGASFLNGLSGTGTVTAATGEVSGSIPAGLLWNNTILAATIAAGDVTNQNILVGKTVELDEDKVVLENSLTLDTVVTPLGKTIRKILYEQGIYCRPARYFQAIQPIA